MSLKKIFLNHITFCESLRETDNCGSCHTCMKWKFYESKGWIPYDKERFNKNNKKENNVEMWEPVEEEIVEEEEVAETLTDIKILD